MWLALAFVAAGPANAGDREIWSGHFWCGMCPGCDSPGIDHYITATLQGGTLSIEDPTDSLSGSIGSDGHITLTGRYHHPDAAGETELDGSVVNGSLSAAGMRGPRSCNLTLDAPPAPPAGQAQGAVAGTPPPTTSQPAAPAAAPVTAAPSPASSTSTAPDSGAPNTRGVPRDEAIAVQRYLRQLGLYDGAIDGEIGPASRDAIAKFRGNHHLTSSGWLSDAERELLALEARTQSTKPQLAVLPPATPAPAPSPVPTPETPPAASANGTGNAAQSVSPPPRAIWTLPDLLVALMRETPEAATDWIQLRDEIPGARWESGPKPGKGNCVMQMNGSVPAHFPMRSIPEQRYNITACGARSIVLSVGISASILGADIPLEDTLKAAGPLQAVRIFCGADDTASESNALWKLTSAGKAPLFLTSERSCGSAGCTDFLTGWLQADEQQARAKSHDASKVDWQKCRTNGS